MERINQLLLFGVLPAVGVVLLVNLLAQQHLLALDFHHWYWPAGHRVLLGQSPYQLPYPQGLNYPALTALVFTPWALLPPAVADPAFTVLAVLSVGATLTLLNVRDWRIYGVTLMSPAITYGWQTANLSLLLVTGIAAAWYWRDRPFVAGVLLAVIVAIKPVYLPIALWLLATRRYRATAYAAATATLLTLGSFAVLGFGQLNAYMTQTQLGLADNERRGYSIFSLVLKLGGAHAMAYAIITAVALLTSIGCVHVGRRGHDRQAISLAIATMLVICPVVESHYFAALVIPLALARPRLSLLWLLPLCLWVTPADWPTIWQRTLVLATYTLLVAASLYALRGSNRPPSASGRSSSWRASAVGIPGAANGPVQQADQ